MVIPLTQPVINEEMKAELVKVFEGKAFLRGEAVKQFEADFAQYIGVKQAIAVNRGMSALLLPLVAMNIGKGDKVITTPATFISTANTIILAGAEPVFADIDMATYNISPDRVREVIGKYGDKVKAIIPVHLYGYPCDMDSLLEVTKKHNIKIIEDAAQAHGAQYNNKKIGSIGDVGAFSFYPTKIITVAGDGGMITTNNEEIAEKCRELGDDGMSQNSPKDGPDIYTSIGYAARMNTINAAMGRIQLKFIDEWNKNRSEIASLYLSELNGIGDMILPSQADSKYGRVWYIFAIRTGYRDKLKGYLEKTGIRCGISYKIPVYAHPSYQKLGFKGGIYPNTEKWSNGILSLPLYSQMTEEDASYVISHVKKFYKTNVR